MNTHSDGNGSCNAIPDCLFDPHGSPIPLAPTEPNGKQRIPHRIDSAVSSKTHVPMQHSETSRFISKAEDRAVKCAVGLAELADGSLLETIEDPLDSTHTLLARWNNGLVIYERDVREGGKTLVPLRRDDPILRHIRLPRGAKPYGSISDLTKRIERFLARLVKLPDEVVPLAVGFALATWIADRLRIPPYLLITGPVAFQRTAFLKALALVCRHPLLTDDFTAGGLYRASELFSATLLIDEPSDSGSTKRHQLLRLGAEHDFVGLRHNGCFSASGPRVISVPSLPDNKGLRARCLAISMGPGSSVGISGAANREILEASADLQQELLMFRFETYKVVHPLSVPDAEGLRQEAQEILSCLAAPFTNDANYRRRLLDAVCFSEELFEPLDIEQQAVLSALFFFTHAVVDVTVKRLGEMANLGLLQMEEGARMSDRKVGSTLDSLGYCHRHRDAQGWHVRLDRSASRMIHLLVKEYGCFELDTEAYQAPRLQCEWCREEGLISPAQEVIDRFRIKEQEERVRPFLQEIEELRKRHGVEELSGPAEPPGKVSAHGGRRRKGSR